MKDGVRGIINGFSVALCFTLWNDGFGGCVAYLNGMAPVAALTSIDYRIPLPFLNVFPFPV